MLREDTVKGIPVVVRHTVECLRGERARREGIFRVEGPMAQINALKEKFNQGICEDLSTYDIHVISNVLKLFFREMPVPLFTFELWEPLLSIAEQLNEDEDMNKAVSAIKTCLDTLPHANHHLLQYICMFLKEISQFSDVTKMTISNLAIVFAGNLLRPQVETDSTRLKHGVIKRVIETIVTHTDTMFEKPKESEEDLNWFDSLKKYMIVSGHAEVVLTARRNSNPTPIVRSEFGPSLSSISSSSSMSSSILRATCSSESSSSSDISMISSRSFISLKRSGNSVDSEGDNADESVGIRPRRSSDPEKPKSSPDKAKRKSSGRNNASHIGEFNQTKKKSNSSATSPKKSLEGVNTGSPPQ